MEWLKLIGSAFKIIGFFINLWKEKDAIKAEKKAHVGRELVNAFKETDKDRRASRLNAAIGKLNRL